MRTHKQNAIQRRVRRDKLLELGGLNEQQRKAVAEDGWHLELCRLVEMGMTDQECDSLLTQYPGNPHLVPNEAHGRNGIVRGMMYTDIDWEVVLKDGGEDGSKGEDGGEFGVSGDEDSDDTIVDSVMLYV